ncbi:Phytanoyl-CoA dioxygenase (PhyH) [Polaromonas sp. YR568]|uniref:phytanoyl-CoA dioxygenase family protein n=1 Tax=Polaromonas sp. YR568 TaxID=1855301 RepID=UPI0008E7F12B|nr:phytanoyl-CoA dioxygenase family protein [Polaromonas sp. YR568]SFU85061.1 Phytanoyl-CoA dioxygenase (PhyH) [Polaromonas sp. YR568]
MNHNAFTTQGFTLAPQVLTADECESAGLRLAGISTDSAGTRGLLSQAWCQALAATVRGNPLVAQWVPADFAAVQCTYFEKSVSRNWLVPAHQDLSIPVAAHVEHAGLGGWSEKEGSLYVQPPVELLQQLVAVRVHIDACGAGDGPLRVVPGSHLLGKIAPEAAALARRSQPEVVCTAERGAAMAMRPLLLHASSRSTGAGMRRVLHFLFGPRILPFGLQWQQAI